MYVDVDRRSGCVLCVYMCVSEYDVRSEKKQKKYKRKLEGAS